MNIFLCASKYNYKHIPPIKIKLEQLGHVVTLPNSYDDPMAEIRIKEKSAKGHLAIKQKLLKEQALKVKANDAILVVNFDKGNQQNYIGGATFLEMYKAFELNKRIYLYNPIPKGILEDEIFGMNPLVIDRNLELIKNED